MPMNRRLRKSGYSRVPGEESRSDGDSVQRDGGTWVDPAIASQLQKGSRVDMEQARKKALSKRLQAEAEEAKKRESEAWEKDWTTLKTGACAALIILVIVYLMVWNLPPDFHKHYQAVHTKYKEHQSEMFKHVGNRFKQWRQRI